MNEELEKITIRIKRSDLEALRELFPPPVGYNKAIRQIISVQVRILLEQLNREREEMEAPHVDRITDRGLNPSTGNEQSAE